MMRIFHRVYRLLLRCYPAEFRDDYGREMTRYYRERAQSEPAGRLWFDMLSDLARTAPKEHLSMIANDLRYAIRMLRRAPAATVAVIATMALAIGANTAIYSVAQNVMVAPLPFPDSGRLVRLWESNARANHQEFAASLPNFLSWKQARSFSQMAAWRTAGVILLPHGEPERVQVAVVAGPLFGMLGIKVMAGRGFVPADEAPSTPGVILLSHRLWLSRYGGDPKIVGQSIQFASGNVLVAGIVEDEPLIFRDVELFTPLKVSLDENRGNHTLSVIAQLRDGVTLSEAGAEMKTMSENLAREFPVSNDGWSARAVPIKDWIVRDEVRRTVLLLLAAAAMILLIACANVSNVMLSRAVSRGQEMGIRLALGAPRGRLIRLLLTESLLLATLGGSAGVLAGWWGVHILRGVLPSNLPRLGEISLNGAVMLFSIGLTVLTGILFGLAPAWHAARTCANDALRSVGRSATPASRWIPRTLVVAQFSLATTLVAGAGLFLVTLRNMQHVHTGFAADHLLTARIGFPIRTYSDDQKRWNVSKRLMEAMRAVPGVRGVGLSSDPPLSGGDTSQEMYPVGESALPSTEQFMPDWRIVDSDYFQVMGIPLKSGRFFTERDTAETRSIIVSEAYARKLWPNASLAEVVGKQLRDQGKAVHTIVGVVGDVRNLKLTSDPSPINYFAATEVMWLPSSIVIRTEGDPQSVTQTLRQQVRRIDPRAPVFDVATMEQFIYANTAGAKLNTALIGGFAVLALALGAVGIYGVIAYAVSMREREIGVRMALGASAGRVLRMVLREGMLLAAAGVAAGVTIALALGQLARTLLFGVEPQNPIILVTAALTMAIVGFAGTTIPARRAAHIDPLAALRGE